MRKPLIAGNWKMNKTATESKILTKSILDEIGEITYADVVIVPPYTSLSIVNEEICGSKISLGAQNISWEESGAYTGEVSPEMLKDIGCKYVIIGHSERREYFNETNKIVNKKAKTALKNGLTPIICVGESLEDREGGSTSKVIEKQIQESLNGFSKTEINKSILAYEPIWAIGTGKTATPEQANAIHTQIRSLVKNMADADVANSIIILYGGSVNPTNSASLFSQKDIDGGLIGGASLKTDSFVTIIKSAER